jgi:hypothetical protein
MYEQCKVTAEDLVAKQRKSNKSFDLTPWMAGFHAVSSGSLKSKYTKSEWNDKAMQLTAYIQTAGLDDELLQAAAENHRGIPGGTPAELLSELRGKQNSVIPWSVRQRERIVFDLDTLPWLRTESANASTQLGCGGTQ